MFALQFTLAVFLCLNLFQMKCATKGNLVQVAIYTIILPSFISTCARRVLTGSIQ